MEKWQKYRTMFPHTNDRVYLNHAALSPMHNLAINAIDISHQQRANDNIEFWPDALEVKQRFKSLLGRLINANPDNIAVTDCTSMGLNWLAQGLDWKPGDRVLLNNFEFPSNVIPFLNLKRLGVEIDFVPHRNGRVELSDIAEMIRPETRLLSISFVEFLNGYRNDLKAIGQLCRENDVIFCVDGIQGLGALQMDVEDLQIDFLACGGQKWMMWPLGTAFMYIAPRIFDWLTPMAPGWLSVNDSWEFFKYELDLLPTAERFEPGMYNVAGVVGASASLEMFLDIGPDVIERRVLGHSDYLIHRLLEAERPLYTPIEKEHRAGIVTFRHPRAEALYDHLLSERIHVSLRDGMIRVAPHFYNTRDELDRLLDEISSFEMAAKRRLWSKNRSESLSQV